MYAADLTGDTASDLAIYIDAGRHILFEATLAGGLNGAFLLSFEEPL